MRRDSAPGPQLGRRIRRPRSDNHVSRVGPPLPPGVADPLRMEALETMDAWLTKRVELAAARPHLDEIRLTRPARPSSLSDGCVTPTGEGINEPLTPEPDATCNQHYPFHGNPRIAAGGPAPSNVPKCRLTEMDRSAYPVEFSDAQWERLQAAFPGGVCDWARPGLGQLPLGGTWLRY